MSAPSPLHPPESVRRFTSAKIGVLLFFFLLLAFFGLQGNEDGTEPQPDSTLAQNQGGDSSGQKPGQQPGTHTESVTFQIAGHPQGNAAAGNEGMAQGYGDTQGMGADGDGAQAGAASGNHAQHGQHRDQAARNASAQNTAQKQAHAGAGAHNADAAAAGPGMEGPDAADMAGAVPPGESVMGPDDEDSAPQPATGDGMIELPGAPSFALTQDANGAIALVGGVPDETTRTQWMNAVRLGARDVPVNGNLRLRRVDPHAAARWEPQLTALVALMRERNLSRVRVRGDAVELVDASGNTAHAKETLSLIRAQVPDGYRVVMADDAQSRAQADARNSRNTRDANNARASAKPAVAQNGSDAQDATSRTPRKTAREKRLEARRAAAEKKAAARDTTATKRQAARESGKAAIVDNSTSSGSASAKTAAGNCKALKTLSAPIYFSSNTASLSAAERRRLRNLGACLGKTARVRVTGHADPRDTAAANLALSERRARVVAGAIAAGGFSASRITVVGAGQAKAKTIKSKAGLQRARRVDIRVN